MLPLKLFLPLILIAQQFDTIAIKPADSTSTRSSLNIDNGVLTAEGIPLKTLIQTAFQVQPRDISGPDWLATATFNIQASAKIPGDEHITLRHLLEDRFGLKWHAEDVDRPVYNLAVAPGGSKLRPADDNRPSQGGFTGQGSTEFLARAIEAHLGRHVIDKTGLPGRYKWRLTNVTWSEPNAALEEQLGMRLEPATAKIKILVIDHIEPTPIH